MSLESKLFYYLLKVIGKKKFLEMQFAFGKFDFYNSPEPSNVARKACHITNHRIGGRNVFTLMPKTHKSDQHILYLHGGAYVQNFVRQHWNFLSMLVRNTHCTITAPDYPLAPRHTYIDAFNMVLPLYKTIMAQSAMENIILMGDSAGGGFALALAQELRYLDIAQSGRLVLLSPWLDITLMNPEIEKINATDPFLSVPALQKAGLSYAGHQDPRYFMVSPINGPLEGLGNISIFVGSNDIMVADARRLHSLAQARNVAINYREYKDMMHVWMLLNFPESRKAQEEIIGLINQKPAVTPENI